MAVVEKTSGIVLQRRFIKEIDGVFRLLTEKGGSLEVRAYGIHSTKKRSALLIEPGCLVEIDYYKNSRGFVSLKEGYVKRRFDEIKKNYELLLLLSYLLELSAFAASYGESPGLFVLLKGSIEEFCRSRKSAVDSLELLVFFQVRLLKLLGLLGLQDRCSVCESPLEEKSFWNLPELHFSCSKCSTQSSQQNSHMAKIIALAGARRFHDFAESVKQINYTLFQESGGQEDGKKENSINENSEKESTLKEKVYLDLWKGLHSCLENFSGSLFHSWEKLEGKLRQL